MSGFSLDIDEATMSGAFDTDGSRIQGGVLAGVVDSRPLGASLGFGTSPDAVCKLIYTFGVVCKACADGTGDYCVDVYIDDLDAPELPDVSVVPLTDKDVAADPDCK